MRTLKVIVEYETTDGKLVQAVVELKHDQLSELLSEDSPADREHFNSRVGETVGPFVSNVFKQGQASEPKDD